MTDVHRANGQPATERRWQIIQTVIGLAILSMVGWGGSQFMSTRDDVHAIQATMPLQFEAINSRLTLMEARETALELKLDQVDRNTK